MNRAWYPAAAAIRVWNQLLSSAIPAARLAFAAGGPFRQPEENGVISIGGSSKYGRLDAPRRLVSERSMLRLRPRMRSSTPQQDRSGLL